MTETNPTLTEFLLARLSEDYADAMSGWRWKALPGGEYERLQARILADVEAKRRIVERCSAVDYAMPSTHLAQGILAELAQPYAAHPEFREEWRQ